MKNICQKLFCNFKGFLTCLFNMKKNMNHLFISPILLDYTYLENLTEDLIMKLDLKLDEKGKNEFKKSTFFNFNRYLVLQIDLLSESKSEKIYNELTFFINEKNEEETLNILKEWDILPDASNDFIDMLLDLKNKEK